MHLTIEIPDKYLLHQSSEDLARQLKLNTAIEMYKNGLSTVSSAVDFVGNIDPTEFLYECKKHGVDPQTYENIEGLEAEVAMLDKELS